MNVSLTTELEEWVNEQIGGGFYQSASEVVQKALFIFRDYDQIRRRQLIRQIKIGLAQADRGDTYPFDEEIVNRVKQQGRKKLCRPAITT